MYAPQLLWPPSTPSSSATSTATSARASGSATPCTPSASLGWLTGSSWCLPWARGPAVCGQMWTQTLRSVHSAWTECPRVEGFIEYKWHFLYVNLLRDYEVNKYIIHFQQNHALACIANSSQALLVMMFLFAHRVYKVYQVEQSNVQTKATLWYACTFPGIKHEEQPRRGWTQTSLHQTHQTEEHASKFVNCIYHWICPFESSSSRFIGSFLGQADFIHAALEYPKIYHSMYDMWMRCQQNNYRDTLQGGPHVESINVLYYTELG